MLCGFCPVLPGQILNAATHEESFTQLQNLLIAQQKRNSLPAVQPSAHTPKETPLAHLPPEITHVYTKQHKALGLQPSFAGPFPLVERLSRSTIEIKVGHKINGEPIFEVRHLNDLKLANPESHIADATRAKRGRPKKQTPAISEEVEQTVAAIDFS